jgi:hypothetical protein
MFWQEMPHYLEVDSLIDKWSQPNFKGGVGATEAAEYFEKRKKLNKKQAAEDKVRAEEIRKIQKISGQTPVYFVLAPKWVAAYVTPWSSTSIFYNLDTLASWADHEHIITHEKIHLRQQAQWWNTEVPGFRELPQEVKALFAKELGLTTLTGKSERELLEGLTENLATQKTRFDKMCSYNQFEVPVAKRFDSLVADVTWMSLTNQFAMMTEGGSRARFRKALLQTANYLVLEHAAEDALSSVKKGKTQLDTNQQEIIRAIGNYKFWKWEIIKISEAKNVLFKASAELIRATEKVSGAVGDILGNEVSDDKIIEQGLSVKPLDSDSLIAEWTPEIGVEILKKVIAEREQWKNWNEQIQS